MISKEIILQFCEAIKQEYGKEINFEEASLILNDLVIYFDTLAKIDFNTQNGP